MNFAEKFNYLDIFKCIDDDFLNIFHDSCDSDYSTPESINSYKDIFMRNLNNYADFFSLDSNKLRNFYNFLLNFEVFFSGHSLGEYSALCAAGVLNFFDCIDILYNRSKLMSEAEDGGMVAIIGSTEDAEKLINHGQLFGICVKANQNCEGQIVLSGSVKVIDEVIKFALEIGVKAIRLSVSGAFHSPLMLDAQNSLKDVLINKVFHDPISGFFSSSTYFNDVMFFGNSIKESMFQQMTHGVNWKNLMNRIVNGDFGTGDLILIQKVKDCLHGSDYFKGVELSSNTDIPNHFENKTLFIEIGPGKILSGLANKHKYDNFNFSLNANELYKHLW
jgi:malonyl CoA-acyl carrier protein transacylase